jgi:dolichol-phosphate mannosyltransferase
MSRAQELSIVIPAYKEGANLKNLLPEIGKVLQSSNIDGEVVIVDTESPMDETPQVCEEFSWANYVNRKGGNSYGDAIRSGLENAHAKWVLFMDGDGSHDPASILSLWKYRNDFDVVIGSRYVDGGETDNSAILIFMSRMVNIIFSLFLSIPCKDVSNSFKLYRNDLFRDLKFSCENFDIVEELLYKILMHYPDVKIKEVPFSFKQRVHGETKRNLFVFILTYCLTLVKLRWMKLKFQLDKLFG